MEIVGLRTMELGGIGEITTVDEFIQMLCAI